METHALFAQFWHTGIQDLLIMNLRIKAPLSHNLNIGADMVGILYEAVISIRYTRSIATVEFKPSCPQNLSNLKP